MFLDRGFDDPVKWVEQSVLPKRAFRGLILHRVIAGCSLLAIFAAALLHTLPLKVSTLFIIVGLSLAMLQYVLVEPLQVLKTFRAFASEAQRRCNQPGSDPIPRAQETL